MVTLMGGSYVGCCVRFRYSGRRLYTFFEVMLSSYFDEARPRQFLLYSSTGLILSTVYLQYPPLLIFLRTQDGGNE